MVRPPDQRGNSRRHQVRPDGCDFYSPYPMALCVRALCPAAWRPVEIGPLAISAIARFHKSALFLRLSSRWQFYDNRPRTIETVWRDCGVTEGENSSMNC